MFIVPDLLWIFTYEIYVRSLLSVSACVSLTYHKLYDHVCFYYSVVYFFDALLSWLDDKKVQGL